MDINGQINYPTAKKWRFWQRNKKYRPFPVDNISGDSKQFIGYFTGLSVEIQDETAICTIYDNGCYGISSKTKGTPRAIYAKEVPKRKLNEADENLQINASASKCHRTEQNTRFHPECIDDKPIGLETELIPKENRRLRPTEINRKSLDLPEHLNLFPEEAFFLHYSLKCLTIIDYFSNATLSTDDILDHFCRFKTNFITHFIAYQYFRSQNWVVKCGLKYGGDFLLYYKGPQYFHASYIVLVKEYSDDDILMECKETQGLYRLGETCKKDILFLQIKYPANVSASNPQECLDNLCKFQLLEMTPKRYAWGIK